MLFNKKSTGLLVAGLAAYGLYRYNKMSDAQKKEMKENLKARGKKIYDDYVPDTVKNLFEKDRVNGKTPAEAPLYTF